jgi:hypothetical protein
MTILKNYSLVLYSHMLIDTIGRTYISYQPAMNEYSQSMPIPSLLTSSI